VYGHDTPRDLSERLAGAGFSPEPPEELMVYDLRASKEPTALPPGVEIRPVRDTAGLDDAASVEQRAWGRPEAPLRVRMEGRLSDPTMELFVAYRDGSPIAEGRLEMPPGKSFASLWGGGTVPEQRGQGVYRGLVEYRARRARERGYPFLTVDARRSSSQPILERQGFVPLTPVVGWVFSP
jgi:GNAT superfamily N-acetyltransferase